MTHEEGCPVASRAAWQIGWDMRAFHGSLRQARRAKGLTQKQLAEIVGVNVQTISGIELLIRRPADALRDNLADFLGLDPQQVWPDWLEPRDKAMKATAYQTMTEESFSALDAKDRGQVRQLEDRSDPEREAIRKELVGRNLKLALDTLSFREREIIKLRYGLVEGDGYGVAYTLQEVGRIFNVTRDRVRQIEVTALRKLQHPARAKLLDPLAEECEALPLCGRCDAAYAIARFCRDCGRQGCGRCMGRFTRGSKYIYLCVPTCTIKGIAVLEEME